MHRQVPDAPRVVGEPDDERSSFQSERLYGAHRSGRLCGLTDTAKRHPRALALRRELSRWADLLELEGLALNLLPFRFLLRREQIQDLLA